MKRKKHNSNLIPFEIPKDIKVFTDKQEMSHYLLVQTNLFGYACAELVEKTENKSVKRIPANE